MNKLNLINNDDYQLAIIQGATYNRLVMKLTGDYSDADFRGEIRKNTLENNGELLASFDFIVDYDGVNHTTIMPILTAQQTSLIPSTKWQGVGDITPRNGWLWDLEAHYPDRVEKIIALSFVQVIPEITNGD